MQNSDTASAAAIVAVSIAALAASIALLRRWLLLRTISRDANVPYLATIRRELDRPEPKAKLHRDLPVKIMPHLLLGDRRCASDDSIIESFGVTHILNVAGKYGASDVSGFSHSSGNYLQINAQDEEGYDIMQHLPEASAFIRRALAENGRCLIHCQAGINRSGALACAELMLHEQVSIVDAVTRCKEARGVILSNHSFQEQLVKLARTHELLGDVPVCTPSELAAAANTKPPRKPAAMAFANLAH
mmetsp:Transcript_862/g.2364  ORF Transcript_862/g.2364 Transcript_862/m.2364 type:complete len:246 (+) Transcript_862:69-806(+)